MIQTTEISEHLDIRKIIIDNGKQAKNKDSNKYLKQGAKVFDLYIVQLFESISLEVSEKIVRELCGNKERYIYIAIHTTICYKHSSFGKKCLQNKI